MILSMLVTMRAKRFAGIGGALLCLLSFTLIAMSAAAESPQDKILEDLRVRSEGKSSPNYIGGFDLICFTQSGDGREELLREDERLAANFSAALKQCGTNRSCCNMSSHGTTVALIKNRQILCVEVHKFTIGVKLILRLA